MTLPQSTIQQTWEAAQNAVNGFDGILDRLHKQCTGEAAVPAFQAEMKTHLADIKAKMKAARLASEEQSAATQAAQAKSAAAASASAAAASTSAAAASASAKTAERRTEAHAQAGPRQTDPGGANAYGNAPQKAGVVDLCGSDDEGVQAPAAAQGATGTKAAVAVKREQGQHQEAAGKPDKRAEAAEKVPGNKAAASQKGVAAEKVSGHKVETSKKVPEDAAAAAVEVPGEKAPAGDEGKDGPSADVARAPSAPSSKLSHQQQRRVDEDLIAAALRKQREKSAAGGAGEAAGKLPGDQEVTTAPAEAAAAKSAEGPAEAAAKPEDAGTQRAKGAGKPEEAATQLAEGVGKPEEAATQPLEGAGKPEEAATQPADQAASSRKRKADGSPGKEAGEDGEGNTATKTPGKVPKNTAAVTSAEAARKAARLADAVARAEEVARQAAVAESARQAAEARAERKAAKEKAALEAVAREKAAQEAAKAAAAKEEAMKQAAEELRRKHEAWKEKEQQRKEAAAARPKTPPTGVPLGMAGSGWTLEAIAEAMAAKRDAPNQNPETQKLVAQLAEKKKELSCTVDNLQRVREKLQASLNSLRGIPNLVQWTSEWLPVLKATPAESQGASQGAPAPAPQRPAPVDKGMVDLTDD